MLPKTDLPANPDAVDGHRLIAGKADHPGRKYPPQIVQGLGVKQPVDGLPGRNDGGESNNSDDEESREVFCPPVAIGVSACCCPASQDEGDP